MVRHINGIGILVNVGGGIMASKTVRVCMDSHGDCKKVAIALFNAGYKVWSATDEGQYMKKYYICFSTDEMYIEDEEEAG